jgi:hypothetical protein
MLRNLRVSEQKNAYIDKDRAKAGRHGPAPRLFLALGQGACKTAEFLLDLAYFLISPIMIGA